MKRTASSWVRILVVAGLVACGGSKSVPAGDPLFAVISKNPDLSKLVTLVNSAGISDVFNSQSPLTFFAPSNSAINALGQATIEKLGQPENKEMLRGILKNHLVAGKVMAADLAGKTTVKSEAGKELAVSTEGGASIGGAKVVQADVTGANGVIHIIDKVLLPN
jgi:uncharacterized surface protein with fasciclin (FAS1) repeats